MSAMVREDPRPEARVRDAGPLHPDVPGAIEARERLGADAPARRVIRPR
jgi:hypothetical protein